MSLEIKIRQCPICHKGIAQHSDDEIIHCRDQDDLNHHSEQVTRELFKSHRVSRMFGKQTFENWVGVEKPGNIGFMPEIKCVYGIKDWISTTNQSLYIHGECGTGKTYAARCVLYQAMQAGKSVAEITAYAMIKHSAMFQAEELLKPYERAQFLLIDDIDKPHWDSKALSFLWWLVNARADNGGRTIITSNVEPKKLRNVFAGTTSGNDSKLESIFQRLHPTTVVGMHGKSRR